VGKSGESGKCPPTYRARLITTMAFRGRAEYSIDAKGRVAIPAKMRAAMGAEAEGKFIAIYGIDRGILLYPKDVWAKKEAELETLNQYRSENREAIRRLFMNMEDAELDGQGRVALPKYVLEAAGLGPSTTALILGAYDKIELWNPAVFEEHVNQRSTEAETLVERVLG